MLSSRYLLVSALISLTFTLAAEDAPANILPVSNGALPMAPGAGAILLPNNWTYNGRLGAHIANVSTSNADTSRDATIATASTSTSYLFTYEGQANWRLDKNSVDNLLKARYGRIRT